MERFVCIHGHFYQPPRENPWLEAIELQESAYPYHDWNERITAECYAPNAFSRILDGDRRIVRLVNNYARISFNFGPTLLSWMEANAPQTYRAVIDADRQSRDLFNGHGSAIAQVYNHAIMPLANRRDKRTQILWGLADFEHRFGRKPEGIWLAETAVDLESLDLMAEQGVLFTILSPYQAGRVRPADGDDEDWVDVTGGRIDPTRPYECKLPSGRSVAVFFYDGPISQAIAFEKLLRKGEVFVERLLGAFTTNRTWPQLVHVATDGETYGHHHQHGDMALAYALAQIDARKDVRLTVYGEYLDRYPPTHEVEILDRTAWSCSHGVGRWEADCGCNTGRGWSQAWRGPLRAAFDWLRDAVAGPFEEKGKRYWADPWAVRDDYVRVILDRGPESRADFFDDHAARFRSPADEVAALKLLELQRNALLMYTSCGWFFDEVSGIETVQCVRYAARVVHLAEEVLGLRLEPEFLDRLALAPSNLPDHKTGRAVYEKYARPARIDLPKVAAHFGVSSLFEDYQHENQVFCYRAEVLDLHSAKAGLARLVVGRARVASEVTLDAADMIFGAVHFGDHNLSGGVRPYTGELTYRQIKDELSEAFGRIDFPATIILLNKHLDASGYSLKSLFRDEQRKILDILMNSTAASIDSIYRQLYAQHALMMRFLIGLDAPLPKPFTTAAEFLINNDLRKALDADEPDFEQIRHLLAEAKTWRVPLDREGLGYALRRRASRLADRLEAGPADVRLIRLCGSVVELADSFGFGVDFWQAQNTFYGLIHRAYPEVAAAAARDEAARDWVAAFRALGDRLNVRVPAAVPVPAAAAAKGKAAVPAGR